MPLNSERDFVRICYYGNPGCGKTTAVAHAAKLGRVAALLTENGMHSRPLTRLNVPTDQIEPIRAVEFKDIREALYRVRVDLHDDADAWSGVVFDSATELARVWLESIVDAKYDKDRKLAEAKGQEYDGNRFFVSRDYYGQITQQWQRVLRDLSDLQCHAAFTAHVRRDVDEDDGSVRYGPDLPPAMQANLMGQVSMLIYMKEAGTYPDGRTVRIGYSHNSGKFTTKDRLAALPRALAFPTLDRVVSYVDGELTEENDPVQQEFLSWTNDKES